MEQISNASKSFEQLLNEQVERITNMDESKVDYAKLDKIIIGIIDGDGIGPIITQQASKILEQLLKEDIEAGKIEIRNINGLTIENRLATNKAIPDDVLAEIKKCHVLLKGPTTTPMGGKMESANVAMRRELDLYANVRPVSIPEKNIDWIFFRENTEGEYVLGSRGVELDGMAVDFKVITDKGTKRIAQRAFEYAKNNGKSKVSIVTKANIMKKTDGKFTEICHEVAKDYPEIEVDDWYIDIMTANLINPQRQSDFEVFVLPNLYGDIITDEAAQLQGGVGTAGSANIGNKYAMFEAIHGSAPRLVEDGLENYASPKSIIKAGEMLLRHIGKIDEANKLEQAINNCNIEVSRKLQTHTCQDYTNKLLELLDF